MSLPTPALQEDCDAFLNNILVQLLDPQQDFLVANAQYWQGLDTHSIIPADGVATAPDQLGLYPDYEDVGWDGMGLTLPADFICDLRCNTYLSVDGAGWVLSGLVYDSGNLYERRINVGYDTRRTQDWTLVELV